MIVFDLECAQGHRFEGWFESLVSFEDQHSKGLVSCPYCGDTDIRRVFSPVALKKTDSNQAPSQEPIDYQLLAKEMVDYMQNNFEDVGHKFASEALKIHYGVSEKKNIRGSATTEEEETLRQEGVDFFKVPWPKTDDEKKN